MLRNPHIMINIILMLLLSAIPVYSVTKTMVDTDSVQDIANKGWIGIGTSTKPSGAQLTLSTGQLTISDLYVDRVLGTNGGRFQLGPLNSTTQSAELQLVPGAAIDHANGIASQIMIFNNPGIDYERFSFSAVNDVYIIDSSYNNNGVSRDMLFQVGGRVDPTPIAGRNAIHISADASVAIHGSNYTADGKTWGSSRFRVVDPGNAGDTRMRIDTRTGTPASNVADSSSIEFARGGVKKWQVGLNVAGTNNDSLDFYDTNAGSLRMTITAAGMVTLAPIAQGNLGTPANGTFAYCSTCNKDATCTGGGTGALAKRLNGGWVCN